MVHFSAQVAPPKFTFQFRVSAAVDFSAVVSKTLGPQRFPEISDYFV